MARAEKRSHPRYPADLTMELHSKGAAAVRGLAGKIADLSIGGMAFETPAELEEGSVLYLKVNVPLEIRGEVRHMRRAGGKRRYGVRFHRIGFGGQESGPKPDSFISAKFRRKAP